MLRSPPPQYHASSHLMNTAQIIRESIRILLLRPTHFQFISIFFFSPLSISLFISQLLIHHLPHIPFSLLKIINQLPGKIGYHPLPIILCKTTVQIIICFPSSVTFSLLGKAATIQAVSDSYNGINMAIGISRIQVRSGLAWPKLLHTCFWEVVILLGLFGVMLTSLIALPKMIFAAGICSEWLGFLFVLGLLGVPFCVAFAHVMVLGNLARVLTVLENECYGIDSWLKAKRLMEGRRHTALAMALLSNLGFRLVECIHEFRLCRRISLWEIPMLLSMYSLLLLLDSVMNVVFYYTCKTRDPDTF